MKRIFLAAIGLLLLAGGAHAQTATSGSNSTSGARSAAGAVAGVNSTINQYGAQIPNNTPGLAPAAVFGTNPCSMGGSAGGAGPGIGITLAFSTSEPGCERRNMAALLFNTDHKAAARELLCDDTGVRAAFARIGEPCAADRPQVSQPIAPPVADAPRPGPLPVRAGMNFATVAEDVRPRAARPDWCGLPDKSESDRAARANYC